jgi:c(7)-type cytochrome triheme protein
VRESTFLDDRRPTGRAADARGDREGGAGLFLAIVLACCIAAPAAAAEWTPLEKDGIHDPASPAIRMLQQPAEALSKLPPDSAGNMVRWVDALEKGVINPRTNIRPETKVEILDGDILMNLNGSMPIVRFPHRAHTLWLDCKNCHEHPFKSKIGANKLSMLRILEGEQCGLCHGAVSFPLTECNRCHSVSRNLQPAVSGAVVPIGPDGNPVGAPPATKR